MEQEKRDAGEILNNRARILINLVVLIVTAVSVWSLLMAPGIWHYGLPDQTMNGQVAE
ncbi:MAG: hypothetical protein ACR2RE_01775 [Geminicoccaceae bacterium]